MRTRDGLPPTVMIWAPRLVSMIQSEDVVLAGSGCTFAFTPAAGRSGRGRVPPAPSHHRCSGLTPLPRASQMGGALPLVSEVGRTGSASARSQSGNRQASANRN